MLTRLLRGKRRAIPLIFVFAAHSEQTLAEQAKEGERDVSPQIEMVVVTGYATAGLDSEITSEYIEKLSAADMTDMFRIDPSISAGGAVGVGQKIVVRNLGESALNIAIDGADQANGVFHHAGRISLEPELLKRVQVEVGAGSATAGPGALGGSINFETKSPSDLLSDGQKFGGHLKASYFDNGGREKLSGTLFADFGSVVSGMLSLVDSTQEELVQDGDGNEIPGTDGDSNLGFAKFVFDFSEAQELSLSYENITAEGEMPYKSEWAGDDLVPTEVIRTTATLNYSLFANDYLNVKSTVYNTENQQNRLWAGDALLPVEGRSTSAGVNLENTSQLGNQELILGLNYRADETVLWGIWEGEAYGQEESGDVLGFYMQDVIELNGIMTLTAGARYDTYRFTDKDGVEIDDSGVSPNISAALALADLTLSLGYAQALRGVEALDPYKAENASYQPDVQAETANNFEVAAEYLNSGFSAVVGVFRSKIQDAILSWDEGSQQFAPWGGVYTNLDSDMETEGYFFKVGYAGEVFGVSADYQSAETLVDGQLATRYLWGGKANNIGETLVLNAYFDLTHNLSVGWVMEAVSNIASFTQDKNIGGESVVVGKEGYSVSDIYVSWVLKEALTLNFTVKNLFDETYLAHAALEDYSRNPGYESIVGQNDPGRDIRLSVGFKF